MELTLFDYYFAHAPVPSEEHIKTQMFIDRSINPHNEPHKPPLRDRIEIEVDYKVAYALVMIEKAKAIKERG